MEVERAVAIAQILDAGLDDQRGFARGHAHAVETARLRGQGAVAQQGVGLVGDHVAFGDVIDGVADDDVVEHRGARKQRTLAGGRIDDVELVVDERVEIAAIIGKRADGAAQREGVDLRAGAVGIAAHQGGGAVVDAQEVEQVARRHKVGDRAGRLHAHARTAGAGDAGEYLVRAVVGHDEQIGRRARGKVAPHGAFAAAGQTQRVGHALGPRRGADTKRQDQHQRQQLAHVPSSCAYKCHISTYDYTTCMPGNCDSAVTMPC